MNTKHYLRLLRTLALAALTAAAAAACSDDTDTDREPLTPPDAANPGIPVTFTANINPGSDADPDTRTVLDSDGNGGFTVKWKGRNDNPNWCDRIEIWAAQGTTMSVPKLYVPTTSGASSELEPKDDSEKLTLPLSGEWKFTAAYGQYSSGNSIATVMLVPQEQSAPGNTNHIARWDFSVATAEQYILDAGSEMPAVINFKFEHKLSALQLRITNQTGEELTVKEIRLFADGGQIAYQRDYDIATGDWKTTREKKADYLQLTASNFPALPSGGTESQDLHMLFFPGYENETLTVTVITSRGEYSRTRRAPDGGFAAGTNYLTEITLRTDGLTAEEKWTEYITNKAELIAFRDKVNNGNTYEGKTVRLTADIDLTGEWTPIGSSSKSFRGTFDGGGHHISGLNVDNSNAGYAGLFGKVVDGTVRNLRVSGNVTTTGDYAGGIAGLLEASSTVENCIFSGTVKGRQYVGGIAGYNNSSCRIAGCHTKGSVTATASCGGGIVGKNQISSSIDGCYSEAEVKASYNTGGIVGDNQSSTVTHCYATGKVSGSVNVGGIAGYTDSGTFTGCIALNPGLTRTSGAAVAFGRIAGINSNNSTTLTSCAAFDGMTITDASNDDFFVATTGEHGTALTATDCLTPAAYTSRDFTEATATTPGWAFSAAPWQYLPWNKVFDSWNISETEYRIAVPDYLKAPVIP